MTSPKFFCLAASIVLLSLFSGCDDKETGNASPDNSAPSQPSNPVPANNATNQSTDVNLTWTCSDPDGDPLVYDVYFGTGSTPPLVVSGQADTTYEPGNLQSTTTYYWRIVAHDDQGHETSGPTWSFATGGGGSSDEVLIPAGSFNMGADYQSNALPIHSVDLPAFYIDIFEVTNAQYKAFCDATARAYPDNPFYYTDYFTSPTYADYPVVNVTWYDARDYAGWAGKRLPTEAEWERAAKGSDDNRHWPWGDVWNNSYANTNGSDDWLYQAPVGSFLNGISQDGCYDMAGNVAEWCEDDWHSDYTDAPADGSAWIDEPRGESRVERGGTWGSSMTETQCAYRLTIDASGRAYNIGFRCARTP
jgi:formylglycine-generating enzyme required for sulfatase activity